MLASSAPKIPRRGDIRVTASRHHDSRELTRRLARARNILANPTATVDQRHAARCLLNRTLGIVRARRPIAPMKRQLQVDVLAEKAKRRLIAVR